MVNQHPDFPKALAKNVALVHILLMILSALTNCTTCSNSALTSEAGTGFTPRKLKSIK